MSDERHITEDEVRKQHLMAVNQPAHWLYLFGVLLGAVALMVGFIALLGATGP